MPKSILFTKTERLKKNNSLKMKRNLIGIVLCLLVLSGCSKKLLTNNPEPETALYEINHKEDVSLVFFDHDQTDGLEKHLAVYKRFQEAFDTIQEVHVFRITDNCIIEFKNYGYYYFNNNGSKPESGMLLSNGVDKPILVTNPEKYIETYESYFKVPFHDKVYYGKLRRAEIADRQKESEKKLKAKFKIDQNYADHLIKNSNISYYPRKQASLNCSDGKVIAKIFNDTIKTKKSIMQEESLYDQKGLIKKYSTFINEALFSEDIYYRNPSGLIDSIVRTDKNGLTSKNVFKYAKDHLNVITVDKKNTMVSIVYHLNDKFQCTNIETLNGSGDVVLTSHLKYDDFGRVIEETSRNQMIKYEYKNQQEEFYSAMKIYSITDNKLVSENVRYEEGNKTIFISKNKNQVLSKNISFNDAAGCTQKVCNYGMDNKLINVYEYFYKK